MSKKAMPGAGTYEGCCPLAIWFHLLELRSGTLYSRHARTCSLILSTSTPLLWGSPDDTSYCFQSPFYVANGGDEQFISFFHNSRRWTQLSDEEAESREMSLAYLLFCSLLGPWLCPPASFQPHPSFLCHSSYNTLL